MLPGLQEANVILSVARRLGPMNLKIMESAKASEAQNLKPMSELLDVLDDAGVLDRDTRLELLSHEA